jgi:hypothetical protein
MRRSSDQPGSSERQEGRLSQEGQTGRRRLARERLRRVLAPTGGRKPGNPQGNPGRSPKLGEPQDRQRGATNPRSFVRSKPSRRRETAKVERDLPGGKGRPTCGSRRGRQLLPSRSTGVDARSPSRWKGDLWKPQERNLTARSGRKNWKASPSGRRRESW